MLPVPPCHMGSGNGPEVERGARIPAPRAEEALRLTGRAEEEVNKFSVAPRGKIGEVGWVVLELWELPGRRLIELVGEPKEEQENCPRMPVFCGVCRRSLRVSSRSLIVKMWWDLEGVAPEK